jgi:hypothetical protein
VLSKNAAATAGRQAESREANLLRLAGASQKKGDRSEFPTKRGIPLALLWRS